jgi:hypothetical protein
MSAALGSNSAVHVLASRFLTETKINADPKLDLIRRVYQSIFLVVNEYFWKA